MTDPKQTSSETPTGSSSTAGRQRAWFCRWLREGAEKAAETFGPPDAAAKHFHEARLEVLRGVRELIDHRIERLSRDKSKGSRIVVE